MFDDAFPNPVLFLHKNFPDCGVENFLFNGHVHFQSLAYLLNQCLSLLWLAIRNTPENAKAFLYRAVVSDEHVYRIDSERGCIVNFHRCLILSTLLATIE